MCEVAPTNKRHKVLHEMHKRQEGRCYYCRRLTRIVCSGTHGQRSDWFADRATIEHIVPRSQGGGKGKNLVLACGGCNNKKGDNPIYVLLLPTFSHA